MTWENTDKTRQDSAHYSILRKASAVDGMAALREFFPEGEADEMNAVLFSTSGVHGTYNTIEDSETHINAPTEETFGEVTFLIVQPRIVALRYGVCHPETQADIDFLKRLRASSHAALSKIGMPA